MQKIIWPVLVVAVIVGAAFFIGFRSASKPLEVKVALSYPSSAASDNASPSISRDTAIAPSPESYPSPAAAAPRSPVTTLSALQRINEEIYAAADSTTAESLALLVSYAGDDNADIRTSAINALIRRDDAAAAPFLRAAAKKTDSSEAVIALLKAADYLELPAANMKEIAALPPSSKVKPPANPLTHPIFPKPATPDAPAQ